MKHSIRVRFTMIFIGLMAAVLLTLWAVNSFFLEGFYTNEKLKLLEEVYDKLNEFVIEKAENGENISVKAVSRFLLQPNGLAGMNIRI